MSKPSCRVQTLADGGLSKIDYCLDCKVFHLKIGYTTLRINPERFIALSGTINTALALFHRQNKTSNGERLTSVPEVENALH